MALPVSANVWVQTDGVDANAGAFDPLNVGDSNNFTTTGATTATPTITCSGGFPTWVVAGMWLFFKSGTSIIPGWYSITANNSGVLTLNAAIGAALLYPQYTPNTVVGIATAAPATSLVLAVDLSRSTGIAYTDLRIDPDATLDTVLLDTLANSPILFGDHVGFLQGNCITITAGTGFTVGRYIFTGQSAGTAAVMNAAVGASLSTGGVGVLGGPFLTTGQAGSVHVGGIRIFVKNGTYTMTNATANTAGANSPITLGNSSGANVSSVIGYHNVPGDNDGTRPTITAGAVSPAAMVTTGTSSYVSNIDWNGMTLATAGVVMGTTNSTTRLCSFTGFTNGCTATNVTSRVERCSFTTCTGIACTACAINCTATACTATPFSMSVAGGYYEGCTATANTGVTTDSFAIAGAAGTIRNCQSITPGRAGFRIGANYVEILNCSNSGGVNGFDASGTTTGQSSKIINSTSSGTSGNAASTNAALAEIKNDTGYSVGLMSSGGVRGSMGLSL